MKSFYVVGLMSGTSLDGMDAVLVSLSLRGQDYKVHSMTSMHSAYSEKRKSEIRNIAANDSLRSAALFSVAWSESSSHLIQRLLKKSRIQKSKILAVGVHGQTVVHRPDLGVTIQLGDLSRLAYRLGIPVVGNFRTADVAAGGQGAPLAPHGHALLLGRRGKTTAVQNLGGMGNVTLLKGTRVLKAFDTGPGNIWIDTVAHWKTRGRLSYDRNGALARQGRPNESVVRALLAHPYFRKAPPKSCGWEEFGPAYLQKFRTRLQKLRTEDALATVTHASARATVHAYRRWVMSKRPLEMICTGGGARNRFLLNLMQDLLPNLRVVTSEKYDIPVGNMEALCFAILAIQTLRGKTNNEPAATGARTPVIAGEIALGCPSRQIDRLTGQQLG